MQENINFTELEKSLNKLRDLTENVSHNLTEINQIVNENVNSGVGVWDSMQASLYKERWNQLSEEFPEIINVFQKQESNLLSFITNMKQGNE